MPVTDRGGLYVYILGGASPKLHIKSEAIPVTDL
jgi:hypothetical protein